MSAPKHAPTCLANRHDRSRDHECTCGAIKHAKPDAPKHTPGRLALLGPGVFSPTVHEPTLVAESVFPDPVTEARYLPIATVHRTKHSNPCWRQAEESGANAQRLMDCWNACEGINPEAVPAMLAALERIAEYGGMGASTEVKGIARAALAQAKGEA